MFGFSVTFASSRVENLSGELVLSEQIASFLLGYVDVVILLLYLRYVLKLDFQGQMSRMLLISFLGSLIGVSLGIFVGSMGRMKEGIKIGIILGISMICSFLSGLMNGRRIKYESFIIIREIGI